MGMMISNTFTSYLMEDNEIRAGNLLTELQKQVLHNLMADKAQERLNLEVDTLNPQAFIQQEAYLKGQIDMLRYRLELSEAEEDAIREEAIAASNANK